MKTLITYLLVSLSIAFLLFYINSKLPFLRFFFETDPPIITLNEVPEGLGRTPQTFSFKVKDMKSGIEIIRVRAEQSSNSVELYSKTLPFGTNEHEVEILLDAIQHGFKRGVLKVVIEAFDRSLESNGARHFFEVPIRFDAPDIEVLTTQHNTQRTGMEFVLYRVKSDSINETGVQIGSKRFRGFQAYLLDPDFSEMKDLYFSFFVIPQNFDDSTDQVNVFATSEVGNISKKAFYYRVRSRAPRNWDYNIEDVENTSYPYYSLLENILQGLPFVEERFWFDSLKKSIGTTSSPQIGDTISLIKSDKTKKSFSNYLLTFRTNGRVPVILPNPGFLVYNDKVEHLGRMIVVDHGFGLVSVFLGLDSDLRAESSSIQSGLYLGNSSKLAHFDSYGYEYGLFFQGMPVKSGEWWDRKWINDHILQKISEIKVRNNIQTEGLMKSESDVIFGTKSDQLQVENKLGGSFDSSADSGDFDSESGYEDQEVDRSDDATYNSTSTNIIKRLEDINYEKSRTKLNQNEDRRDDNYNTDF